MRYINVRCYYFDLIIMLLNKYLRFNYLMIHRKHFQNLFIYKILNYLKYCAIEKQFDHVNRCHLGEV